MSGWLLLDYKRHKNVAIASYIGKLALGTMVLFFYWLIWMIYSKGGRRLDDCFLITKRTHKNATTATCTGKLALGALVIRKVWDLSLRGHHSVCPNRSPWTRLNLPCRTPHKHQTDLLLSASELVKIRN
jgi:hypothetical protein